jgi:phosphoglycerol transferase MdoB-like AlkP superfamily enzyme
LLSGCLITLTGLLFLNFHYQRLRAWISLCCILVIAGGCIRYSAPLVSFMDDQFGNSVWDQRTNYIRKGATLYSLQETIRFFKDIAPAPAKKAVFDAALTLLATSGADQGVPSPASPRNVYLILLESFWDPLLLKGITFNQDPLGPAFRALWKDTGYSTAMSPVFGGYTANAEFESLCGFPVIDDDVKFERRMNNAAPCLPAVLDKNGYDTVAAHPNIPEFWNRINAYKRSGFKTYWSIKDFQLDDMNLSFLSDSSLYEQVTHKLAQREQPKQAVFSYIVTYFGHCAGPLLYPRNESRPDVINCVNGCETPEIESYANAAFYKAKELTDFLDQLRASDPDALIVAFGDHLPYLGDNFQGYVEAGTLADSRDEFTPEMLQTYVSTPLIVIDGQQGPQKLGSLPLYQLPGLILGLLGINETTIMHYAQGESNDGLRPLWGITFINSASTEKKEICKDPQQSSSCWAATTWLDQLLTVGVDIFQGKQYSLPIPVDELSQIATKTTSLLEDQAETQTIQ